MRFTKTLCLLSFFIFCFSSLSARNFYISSTDGNDAYSSSQAQNPATPWQSISKANAFFSSLSPGDFLLFKRGDYFYGTLVANGSGNGSSDITIGAYGSGARPVITGFTTTQNWSSLGNGVWQCSVPGAATNINLVTVDGKVQAMGRYPNADAANGGYFNFESYVPFSSITDYELSGAQNWAGASLVMRKTRWIIDVCTITSQSGNTIYYKNLNNRNDYEGMVNFGYFIQNDPRTLDQFGEWYFNAQNKTLQMFFGASGPGSHAVYLSSLDNVVDLSNAKNVTLDNIAVEGSNQNAILCTNGNSVTIQNSQINNGGNNGIYVSNVPNLMINNNTINNILNNGIYINNTTSSTNSITNNIIRSVGFYAGMGKNGDDTYTGLYLRGSNFLAQSNILDDIGYNGIQFWGNNIMIKNNYVNNFCHTKDDGAGIYTAVDGTPNFSNRVVTGNIVTNARGAQSGTDNPLTTDGCKGIYLDVAAHNVDVTNNSVGNIVGSGLFFNNIQNVKCSGNTVFNTQNALGLQRYNGGPLLQNNTFTGNTFFPLNDDQSSFFYWNGELNVPRVTDIQSNMRAIGYFDNNIYRNDVAYPFSYIYHTNVNGSFFSPPKNNLEQWKSFIGQDGSSVAAAGIAAYTINRVISGNTVADGKFDNGIVNDTYFSGYNNFSATADFTGKIDGGSIKITPYSLANQPTQMYGPLGAVIKGKTYLLKITTLGTTINGSVKAYLRQRNAPYNTISASVSKFFGSSVQTNEFLITPTASESNANYLIEVLQSSGTVYVDNIEFYEVDASLINAANQARFEYNASASSKTVSLDGNYIGVDYTKYPGTITLAPFTSKILLRDGTSPAPVAPATPPPAIAAPDNGSFTASAQNNSVACFGGTTTATINATGGTAPFAGTGNFVTSAGKGALKVSSATTNGNNYIALYSMVGAVSSDKNFTLRFTTLGTAGNGTVRASLRNTIAPYATVAARQVQNFGTSRVEHEFVFNNPTYAANTCFLIEIAENAGPVLIDNIAFFESAASGALISQNLYPSGGFENGISGNLWSWSTKNDHLLEWDTNSAINAINYFTVTDATGAKSTTGVLTSQPATPLQATASVAGANGNPSIVTINATGGAAPYAGTGDFTANPGTYNYNVTDANGCVSSISVNVGNSVANAGTTDEPVISLATNCNEGNTTIVVSATGGKAPYKGTGNFKVATNNGSLKLSCYNPVNNGVISAYYSIGSVTPDKHYVLRFSTLNSVDGKLVRASIRQSGSPYATVAPVQTAAATSAQKDFQFVFHYPASTGDASFLIDIPQFYGASFIDNIGFFESDYAGNLISKNLYPSGDFENGIGSVFTSGTGNTQITEWDNTARMNALSYFTVVDANGVVRTSSVAIQQPNANGCAVTANAKVTNNNTAVNLAAASSTAAVFTGNQAAAVATPSIAATLKISSFPNPAVTSFNLRVEGGTTEKVNISVTSFDGKELYKTTGSSNQNYNFGASFIPGFYTAVVTQGTTVQTLKLVKAK